MKQIIEVGVLGGALAISLAATYLVHHDSSSGASTPDEGVPVYLASPSDLRQVSLKSEAADVTIERKRDDRGEYLWITSTTRTEVSPPAPPPPEIDIDPDDPEAEPPPPPPPPEPEIVETTVSFLGNEQADKVWESFAPFRATRELTVRGVDVDFGFDTPHATLTIDRKAGPITLLVGNATYGERSRYLQRDDRVFLVERRALSRLESSARTFAERRLHPLSAGEVERVTLRHDGQERTWVQRNPDDRARSFWADPADRDTADQAAGNWLVSASRLSALDYVAERPEGLQPVLEMELKSREGPVWTVTLLSGPTNDGSEDDSQRGYYAEGPFTRGLVSLPLSQADGLVADLPEILAGTSELESEDEE
ncbi:MAG: DUF4340 domain-containing protein [Deltaproteobacteria bacterium]|nr:MAG: DUF4340 domain-containing protein [Deltaproteobacteria bacterium]